MIRRLGSAVALVALVAIWFTAITAFAALPATIPTHFRLDGTADGYGSKGTIFLLPTIATLVCAALLASGRLGARSLNLPFTIPPSAIPRAIDITHTFVAVINAMAMLLLWAIVTAMIAGAHGAVVGTGALVWSFLAANAIAVAVYVTALYRLRT